MDIVPATPADVACRFPLRRTLPGRWATCLFGMAMVLFFEVLGFPILNVSAVGISTLRTVALLLTEASLVHVVCGFQAQYTERLSAVCERRRRLGKLQLIFETPAS